MKKLKNYCALLLSLVSFLGVGFCVAVRPEYFKYYKMSGYMRAVFLCIFLFYFISSIVFYFKLKKKYSNGELLDKFGKIKINILLLLILSLIGITYVFVYRFIQKSQSVHQYLLNFINYFLLFFSSMLFYRLVILFHGKMKNKGVLILFLIFNGIIILFFLYSLYCYFNSYDHFIYKNYKVDTCRNKCQIVSGYDYQNFKLWCIGKYGEEPKPEFIISGQTDIYDILTYVGLEEYELWLQDTFSSDEIEKIKEYRKCLQGCRY